MGFLDIAPYVIGNAVAGKEINDIGAIEEMQAQAKEGGEDKGPVESRKGNFKTGLSHGKGIGNVVGAVAENAKSIHSINRAADYKAHSVVGRPPTGQMNEEG